MEQVIRELINTNDFYGKYFKNNIETWNKLCASMDVIGDTTLAIESYFKKDIIDDNGEKYLRLYGILQAVYLQQDAIKELYESIKQCVCPLNDLKEWDKFSLDNWSKIRKYRNLTIGHTVKCETYKIGKSVQSFIIRVHIFKETFEVVFYDEKNIMEHESINLKKLIENYKLEALKILEDLGNVLKRIG